MNNFIKIHPYKSNTEEIVKAVRNLDKDKLKILWKDISDRIPKEFLGVNSDDQFRYYLKSKVSMNEFFDLLVGSYDEFDCIFGKDHKAKTYTTKEGHIHMYECLDTSNNCDCRKHIILGRYDIIRLISSITGKPPIGVIEFLKEVFEVKCNVETITGEKREVIFYKINSFYFDVPEYFDR
jgi:hypothetical protein